MTAPMPFTFPRFDGNPLCAEIGDDSVFFPEKGGSAHAAKRICNRCEVRDQCLEWALTHGEHGVWGGLGDKERQRLRKKTRASRLPKPIEHGTDRGAQQHRRRGEDPCAHCATAATAAWTARQKRDECPVCGEWMLKSSIPRHMERRHPQAQEDVA